MSELPSSAGSPVHTFRLDNGLKVLVASVDRPAVSTWLVVDAGTADELPQEAGLAHLLEHMLFKGTPDHPVGAATAAIEGLGGDLNAWTSHDQTALHATLDVEGWRLSLQHLSDMMQHPILDPHDVRREIDVVVEEIRAADNDPDSMLADRVQQALWGPHPYGRRVLGTERSLRHQSPESLRTLLRREYHAGRARLAVAGPVDPSEVLLAAQELFGGWAQGSPRRLPQPMAPAAPGASQVVRLTGSWKSSAVDISWPLPPPGHPDLVALQVLAALLGQGAGAMLPMIIQHDEPLTFGAWAELVPAMFGSTFGVGFVPNDDGGPRAIERTFEVIDELARSERGPGVDRMRNMLVADFLFGEETVDSIAHDLIWYDAHHGGPAGREQQRRAMQLVTAADVRRVAATWLSREQAVVGVLDERITEVAVRRILHTRPAQRSTSGRSGAATQTSCPPSSPLAEAVIHRHDKGPTVAIHPSERPIVAVRLLSLGGDLRLNERQAGLGGAWTRMALAGAGLLDPQGIGEALDTLAADIEPSSGRHTTGFSITAPASNAHEVLRLLGDLVLDPHLEEDELARVRDEITDDIRTRDDRPEDIAGDLSRQLRWAGHPWRLPALGTAATIANVTTTSLRRWHEAHFGGPSMFIAVHGGVDPDAVMGALSWLDELSGRGDPLPARPAPRPRLSGVHTVRAGREQAHVMLVGQGVPFAERGRRGLQIAATLLDGQAGRLFQQLRERQGLAYEVWASATEGLDGGTLRIGLACAPERVEEAAAGLRASLQGLIDQPLEADEIERARRQILGRLRIDEQRTSARASALARRLLLGVPEPLPELRARLTATSPADVVAEVQRMLHGGLAEIRVLPVKQG